MHTVFGPEGKLYALMVFTREVRAYAASLDGTYTVFIPRSGFVFPKDPVFFQGISFGSTAPDTLAYTDGGKKCSVDYPPVHKAPPPLKYDAAQPPPDNQPYSSNYPGHYDIMMKEKSMV